VVNNINIGEKEPSGSSTKERRVETPRSFRVH
jgi:hypothetical protein